MNKNLEITELAIVIAAPNYDPTLLNPSLLTYSGIIPSDWELARQPVVSQKASQLIYTNGVNLIAQPHRLSVIEPFKPDQPVETPQIIERYIKLLPQLDYQAVGLNFRGYISFPTSSEGAYQYLFKTLLAPGNWLKSGTAPVQAVLNFVYTFNEHRLNLSINEASLQLPEAELIPIILFSGNFDYDLSEKPQDERKSSLESIISNWHTNKEIYTEVVNKFVEENRETENIIPLAGAIA